MILAAFSICILQHDYHAVASTVYVLGIGSAHCITVCVCLLSGQQSQLGVATFCMLSRSVFQ